MVFLFFDLPLTDQYWRIKTYRAPGAVRANKEEEGFEPVPNYQLITFTVF